MQCVGRGRASCWEGMGRLSTRPFFARGPHLLAGHSPRPLSPPHILMPPPTAAAALRIGPHTQQGAHARAPAQHTTPPTTSTSTLSYAIEATASNHLSHTPHTAHGDPLSTAHAHYLRLSTPSPSFSPPPHPAHPAEHPTTLFPDTTRAATPRQPRFYCSAGPATPPTHTAPTILLLLLLPFPPPRVSPSTPATSPRVECPFSLGPRTQSDVPPLRFLCEGGPLSTCFRAERGSWHDRGARVGLSRLE
jgi:hypothetical protein